MAPQASHDAAFYVIFEAQVYNASRPYVSKIRAVRLAKTKPALRGGEIALKFHVSIPDAAFLRLIPDVEVQVPDGFWTSQPVEVLVAEPSEAETS